MSGDGKNKSRPLIFPNAFVIILCARITVYMKYLSKVVGILSLKSGWADKEISFYFFTCDDDDVVQYRNSCAARDIAIKRE